MALQIDIDAVLVLTLIVFGLFTVNLWYSWRWYLRVIRRPEDRRRHQRANALRGLVKSLILWIAMLSILSGRVIASLVLEGDPRRYSAAINVALFSGAFIVGGLWLVVSWVFDEDGDDENWYKGDSGR